MRVRLRVGVGVGVGVGSHARLGAQVEHLDVRALLLTHRVVDLLVVLDALLQVGRPSKYQGPMVAASTWQALTGQLGDGGAPDASTKVIRRCVS